MESHQDSNFLFVSVQNMRPGGSKVGIASESSCFPEDHHQEKLIAISAIPFFLFLFCYPHLTIVSTYWRIPQTPSQSQSSKHNFLIFQRLFRKQEAIKERPILSMFFLSNNVSGPCVTHKHCKQFLKGRWLHRECFIWKHVCLPRQVKNNNEGSRNLLEDPLMK